MRTDKIADVDVIANASIQGRATYPRRHCRSELGGSDHPRA
jgi:hypothetical protein